MRKITQLNHIAQHIQLVGNNNLTVIISSFYIILENIKERLNMLNTQKA